VKSFFDQEIGFQYGIECLSICYVRPDLPISYDTRRICQTPACVAGHCGRPYIIHIMTHVPQRFAVFPSDKIHFTAEAAHKPRPEITHVGDIHTDYKSVLFTFLKFRAGFSRFFQLTYIGIVLIIRSAAKPLYHGCILLERQQKCA